MNEGDTNHSKEGGAKDLDMPENNGGDNGAPASPDVEAMGKKTVDESHITEGGDGSPPKEAVFTFAKPVQYTSDSTTTTGRFLLSAIRFNGEILIVDHAKIHIRAIRDSLTNTLKIDPNKIHESTTRLGALELVRGMIGENKLLVFSDIYEYDDMCADEFLDAIRGIKKNVYVVLCSEKIKIGFQEMPRLDPSKGDLVDMAISRYPDPDSGISRAVDNFMKGRRGEIIGPHIDGPAAETDGTQSPGVPEPSQEGAIRPEAEKEAEEPVKYVVRGGIGDKPIDAEPPEMLGKATNSAAEEPVPAEEHAGEPAAPAPTQLSEKESPSGDESGKPVETIDEAPILPSTKAPVLLDEGGQIVMGFIESKKEIAADGLSDKGVSAGMETNGEEVPAIEPVADEPQKKPIDARESYPPPSPLHTWVDAELHLPGDNIARKIARYEELKKSKLGLPFEKRSEIEDQMSKLKDEIEKLGGDPRKRAIEVLSRYKIEEHSAWHQLAFGGIEKEYFTLALNILRDRFGIPVEKIVVTDRGMGTGRSLRMLIELVENMYGGEETSRRFAGNIRGFDLMKSNVDKARQVLAHYGVPPEKLAKNLTIGDFTSDISKCDERYKNGETHLDICLMRSCFHCVTEDDWKNFLIQIAKNLAPGTEKCPGGIAIIDTVAMRRGTLNSMRNPEARRKLDDLKNLYPSLWRKYCHDNQHRIKDINKDINKDIKIDLTLMRRFPIYDNTTGQGFYWREIATVELFNYIIKKSNLDLSVDNEAAFPGFEGIKEENLNNFLTNLGKDFIRQNDLEGVYRGIIRERIEKKIVVPKDILLGSDVEGEKAVDALIDYVALHMTKGFGSEYIFLERPQKRQKSGS